MWQILKFLNAAGAPRGWHTSLPELLQVWRWSALGPPTRSCAPNTLTWSMMGGHDRGQWGWDARARERKQVPPPRLLYGWKVLESKSRVLLKSSWELQNSLQRERASEVMKDKQVEWRYFLSGGFNQETKTVNQEQKKRNHMTDTVVTKNVISVANFTLAKGMICWYVWDLYDDKK